MARKKVKLAWITNDSARKTSYKKRSKGLMKKVNELSILCGVDVFAAVYKDISEPQPDQVWPTELDQAHKTLAKFKRLPDMSQSRSMLNLEGILEQRVNKLREELTKLLNDNKEMELTPLLHQNMAGTLDLNRDIGIVQVDDLLWLIDIKITQIMWSKKRLQESALLIPTQNNIAADDDQHRRRMIMNVNHGNQQLGSTSSAAGTVSAAAAAPPRDQQGKNAADLMAMEALEMPRWSMEVMNRDPNEQMAGNYHGDQLFHHQQFGSTSTAAAAAAAHDQQATTADHLEMEMWKHLGAGDGSWRL